jgi:hypothetical protein
MGASNCIDGNFGKHQSAIQDMGTAAALIAAGFEMISLDKTNPRKVLFIFRHTADMDKNVDLYLANKLDVKARAYWDTIRALKNRLYSE